MSFKEGTASFLVDFIIHTEDQLTKIGVNKTNAEAIAKELCDQMRRTHGGELFYFPKGSDLDAALKHHTIYQEFNGGNHKELAKKYNFSIQHTYRLLKKIHKEETDKRQPQLF